MNEVRAARVLRCILLAAAGAVCLLPSTAHAQSAAKWDKRGQAAEAKQDYDMAFEDYRQAHLKKPTDLRYRERFERLRFQAAALHVDRGRVLRQSGDVPGAITEFARAMQIDPGNQAAVQELQLTQQPKIGGGGSAGNTTGSAGTVTPAGGTPGQVAQSVANSAAPGTVLIPGVDEETPHQAQVKREIGMLSGPVELRPVSTDPITLHMVEDTKIIYQAIGKAAGLNVIFDPEYTAKRIQVDLTNVSLWDALRIVGTLSGTFWKPVTTNTLFVAQNNRTKRSDLSDLALQTFYLTNVSQQNDANEVLVALRNLLDPSSKLFLVTSQNAIVVRATTDELRLAEKVVNDLDRQRAEVVVDVAVLEVSRQKERNLGLTLPQSFGLTPTSSSTTTGSTSTTSTSTSTGTTGTSSTSSNLTLNTLANLNATNFAVTVTGGTVNALLSDTDTRILQNPRIRATDGQRATLKIGSKIPVATGSYSAGAAISTASLGVQTQFQYLDVGVNIDMTPTVHYNREISLKLKVEISSQNGSETISGVTEPIIAQKTAEQVIELKDGEPSLLAGLLQEQDSNTTSGTPFLGEIPFLKYFFSSNDKVRQKDEIVFLLIPHIVRESILTDENTEQVYTGTAQAIEVLRRDPRVATVHDASLNGTTPNLTDNSPKTSAANAANAVLGQLAAQAAPPTPPSAAGPLATGQTPLTLSMTPSTANQGVGSVFQVALTAANAADLASLPLQLQFNPKVLSLEKVDAGPMLSQGNQAVALVQNSVGEGAVSIVASRPPSATGVNGQGTVVTLTFKAMAAGDSMLSLVRMSAKNSQGSDLPVLGNTAVVHVK